jgi:predicted hotdog family 3-hydroxylacyl-ACP dehydratase
LRNEQLSKYCEGNLPMMSSRSTTPKRSMSDLAEMGTYSCSVEEDVL